MVTPVPVLSSPRQSARRPPVHPLGWVRGLALLSLVLTLLAQPLILHAQATYCVPQHPACANSTATITSLAIEPRDFDSVEPHLLQTTACAASPTPGYTLVAPSGPRATQQLRAGRRYAILVTTTAPATVSVWIDNDQDQQFEADEWLTLPPSTIDPASAHRYVGFLTASTLNSLGPTRLRIRTRAQGKPNGARDACTPFDSGETRDYSVTRVRCPNLQGVLINAYAACPGETLRAQSGLATGELQLPVSYRWTGPNGFTATTSAIDIPHVGPRQEGQYIVRARVPGTGGECEYISGFTFRLSTPPSPRIEAEGPTTFCVGGSVSLRALGPGLTGPGTSSLIAYRWSTGATSERLSVSRSGTYTVTITNPCGTVTSAPVEVTVEPRTAPPAPTVTARLEGAAGTLLTSSAALGNQWYKGGQRLVGATAATYRVGAGEAWDAYTVITTSSCGLASPPSVPPGLVTATSPRSAGEGRGWSVHPNPSPAGQALTLSWPGPRPATTLTLTDVLGRPVRAWSLPAASKGASAPLELPGLPAGVYWLRPDQRQGGPGQRVLLQ
ncbi:GEVED domain-containing protein [Hymenobacter sp. HDW8]|uniref:GEVED domain-containing protein n=1 Tax=Hymenobacter sp. HDW8 TaxID=2714932 RepID=UPI00397746E5